jgi:anti-sigma B factor antagonist
VASEHLSIQTSVEGLQALVRLSGELDIDGAPEVSTRLSELAAQALDTVVVDVAGLTFLDSSGLRAILSARNELQSAGATLVLEGVTGTVERVLDATGLRELLTRGA